MIKTNYSFESRDKLREVENIGFDPIIFSIYLNFKPAKFLKMKSTFLLLYLLIFPIITFANTETPKSNEFLFDSLKVQAHNHSVMKDSLVAQKLRNYPKKAKTSGILGIVGIGTMIVLGIASVGTFAVLIGAAISFAALVMGILSVRRVKNKKWARLGIVLGSLGILVLAAWIGLIIYVVYLFGNGFS